MLLLPVDSLLNCLTRQPTRIRRKERISERSVVEDREKHVLATDVLMPEPEGVAERGVHGRPQIHPECLIRRCGYSVAQLSEAVLVDTELAKDMRGHAVCLPNCRHEQMCRRDPLTEQFGLALPKSL